ncbi:hypothetical protein HIM_03118 [Hirsutella minnesotensis 3608]|uniref:Uncharacterized protein n=1 Tax=Hirsutella minnesotensis 3608 TaxID=1043627 RepID=A0A0F7ZSD3_9HYPO|nr:hypothetical protein HIM_09462 [Hirsutella minnesotensis 3608]KJZ73812.1 hypothetical protein HIM_06705 [Hirsutella minnesotensis 3608]KJZ77391.1 hypothetical protein HIM_03115 [Hirsutella minnesotensis 3608]KJZ77394.1 hypothetical protein HIM_03118 [Hirsutella minnesotensis 3608]
MANRLSPYGIAMFGWFARQQKIDARQPLEVAERATGRDLQRRKAQWDKTTRTSGELVA